ncbi:MAG: hypothetical protein ACTSW1_00245 [Candidatus Hodarchaeales archaeon]
MKKERITITLDEQLLLEIDDIREYVPRSTLINNILNWALNFQTADQFLRKNKQEGI